MDNDNKTEAETVESLSIKLGVLTAQNENLTKENGDLRGRLEQVEVFQKSQAEAARVTTRRLKLESLRKDGYAVDVKDELEAFSALDDAAFDRHLGRIPKTYKRSLNGAPVVETLRLSGEVTDPAAPDPDQIGPDDYKAIEVFKATDPDLARPRPGEGAANYGRRVVEKYAAHKKAAKAAS